MKKLSFVIVVAIAIGCAHAGTVGKPATSDAVAATLKTTPAAFPGHDERTSRVKALARKVAEAASAVFDVLPHEVASHDFRAVCGTAEAETVCAGLRSELPKLVAAKKEFYDALLHKALAGTEELDGMIDAARGAMSRSVDHVCRACGCADEMGECALAAAPCSSRDRDAEIACYEATRMALVAIIAEVYVFTELFASDLEM